MQESISFKIIGLDCAHEVSLLKDVLGKQEGVLSIEANILQAKLTITYNSQSQDSSKLAALIRSTGMKPIPWQRSIEEDRRGFWEKYTHLILTCVSGLFLIGGAFFHLFAFKSHLPAIPWVTRLFYLVSIVCAIWYVLPKAWFALKSFKLDINFLMIVAIIGAGIIDEWFEAAMVAFLFAIAIYLEGWSVNRARKAVSSLLELAPTLARVIGAGGSTEEIEVEEVKVGSLVEIRPGEKIPLDGEVVKGTSAVDQSPITGESIPVFKQKGDSVFAGTLNEEGVLVCSVTKRAKESALSKIIQLVEQSRAKRSLSEQFVSHFARVYTPIMILFALAMMIIPPLFFGALWTDWLYRGLVLLVIACPCALVISTPVSIVAGLTAAAKNGILVKGGMFLEGVCKLKGMAIDKTGTLTYGRPEVQKVVPLNAHTEEQLLEKGSALEQHSNHPLAKAILQKATEKGVKYGECSDFKSLQGRGIEAKYGGRFFWLGSHRFMHEKGQETDDIHKKALELEDAGHSVVAIGTDDHVCGLISVADSPRDYVKESLAAIKEAGIKTIVMLTGDNKPTAVALAKQVGIDKTLAELLPQDKVDAIVRLQTEIGPCAMVGDGINDAPALAAAPIGFAMGGMGSDAAIETADIALMTDDLAKIPWLIRHSKKTLQVIKGNIFFALGIKALFIVLALFDWATLWLAIAADTGATVLVVFNSLRLLRR